MRAWRGAEGGISAEDAEALQQQNAALRETLEGARQELQDAYKQAIWVPGLGRLPLMLSCAWDLLDEENGIPDLT